MDMVENLKQSFYLNIISPINWYRIYKEDFGIDYDIEWWMLLDGQIGLI